jgi:protein O-mannosyl-transferase
MTTRRGWSLLIAALAVAASITGLANGFALDDLPIIALDQRAHALSGAWRFCCTSYWPRGYGGGLYRPLTSVLFAIEWALGHGAPLVFHATSIALYVLVCLSVLALARQLLAPGPAALVAALFAVHPAHVEVVGNVVGQSELLVALAVTMAVTVYLSDRTSVASITALFAAAILAKELGVVLPLLLVAAEMTIVPNPRPRWRLAAALGAVAVAYVVVRLSAIGWVFGDTPNPALASLPRLARGWTMLAVAGQWARLLFWPWHLAALYGPPATPILAGPDVRAAAGAAVVVVAIAVATLARRSAPIVTFGILWTGIALLPVTNLIFVSGVLLAERSLFLPSVGAMLAVGGMVAAWHPRSMRAPRLATGLAAVVIGLWLLRSAGRQGVWHDDHTLLVQAVRDEPGSYVAHYQLAGLLLADGQADAGEREVTLAIAQSNGYAPAVAMLAEARARAGDCGAAVPLWRKALSQYPGLLADRLGLANCLLNSGDYAGARAVAVAGVSEGAWVHTFRGVIARADSAAAVRGQ